MTVVITGAGGFIGRLLVARFARQGDDVVAVVRPGARASAQAPSGVRVVEADLSDLRSLGPSVGRADLIMHLAWSGVTPEKRNSAEDQLPNLAYSLDLVEAAAELQAERVVCAGSMSEFALCRGPVTGYEASSPVDLYSATKVAARELMGVRCQQLGVGLVWTLITSVYGPGRDDQNLVSYAIRALLAGQVPEFTGLEQIWDYVYVDDLVEALFLVGRHGVAGRRYPIGSGQARRLADYVTRIRDAIDPTRELGIGRVPYKSATLDCSIPDTSALARDTGFEPRVSFDDGIAATIDYFRGLRRPD